MTGAGPSGREGKAGVCPDASGPRRRGRPLVDASAAYGEAARGRPVAVVFVGGRNPPPPMGRSPCRPLAGFVLLTNHSKKSIPTLVPTPSAKLNNHGRPRRAQASTGFCRPIINCTAVSIPFMRRTSFFIFPFAHVERLLLGKRGSCRKENA
jgi:hypothetical protein